MEKLHFAPVDQTNWTDLEKLFESKGGPHACWCMVWRNMEEGKDRSNKADKKASLENLVTNKTTVNMRLMQQHFFHV